MTCIVALVEGDTVWMGGDSAGVAGWDMRVRSDQKVFRNDQMLFGFTTSFRMGQILRYALALPKHEPCVDVEKFMATTFIDAIRDTLKTHGFAKKTNEQEEGGDFLVGFKGRIFHVSSDYQVGIPAEPYDACGCGDSAARGALFASEHLKGRKRVELALHAAERFSAAVRGPFHVESLK